MSSAQTIDREALANTITWINGRLRMHGGGVELVKIDDPRGAVEVRFAGMCCGCAWKATTWLGTVHDALLAVPGVKSASAPGTAVSVQARQRMRTVLAASSNTITGQAR